MPVITEEGQLSLGCNKSEPSLELSDWDHRIIIEVLLGCTT